MLLAYVVRLGGPPGDRGLIACAVGVALVAPVVVRVLLPDLPKGFPVGAPVLASALVVLSVTPFVMAATNVTSKIEWTTNPPISVVAVYTALLLIVTHLFGRRSRFS